MKFMGQFIFRRFFYINTFTNYSFFKFFLKTISSQNLFSPDVNLRLQLDENDQKMNYTE